MDQRPARVLGVTASDDARRRALVDSAERDDRERRRGDHSPCRWAFDEPPWTPPNLTGAPSKAQSVPDGYGLADSADMDE